MRLLRRIEDLPHDAWHVEECDGASVAVLFAAEDRPRVEAEFLEADAPSFDGEARSLGEANWTPPSSSAGSRFAIVFAPSGDLLRDLVAKFGWLDEELARVVLGAICDALSARHRAGVAHEELVVDAIWIDGARATILPRLRDGPLLEQPRLDLAFVAHIAFLLFTGRTYEHETVADHVFPRLPSERARAYRAAETPAWFDAWFVRCTDPVLAHRFADAIEAKAAIGTDVRFPVDPAREVQIIGKASGVADARHVAVAFGRLAADKAPIGASVLHDAFTYVGTLIRASARDEAVAVLDAMEAWASDVAYTWSPDLETRRTHFAEHRRLVRILPANLHAVLGMPYGELYPYIREHRAHVDVILAYLEDVPSVRARLVEAVTSLERTPPAPKPVRIAKAPSKSNAFLQLLGFFSAISALVFFVVRTQKSTYTPKIPSFTIQPVGLMPSFDPKSFADLYDPFARLRIGAQVDETIVKDAGLREELFAIENGAGAHDCSAIFDAIGARAAAPAHDAGAEEIVVDQLEDDARKLCFGDAGVAPAPSRSDAGSVPTTASSEP